MKLDLEEYLLDYIGNISWYGETNHDYKAKENMIKAEEVLSFLENTKEYILNELEKHQTYREGNASAIMLHKEAKEICKSFDDKFDEDSWND